MSDRLDWADQTLEYAIATGKCCRVIDLLERLSALGVNCFDLSLAAAERFSENSRQPAVPIRVTVTGWEQFMRAKELGIGSIMLSYRHAGGMPVPGWIAGCGLTAKEAGLNISLHLVNAASHTVSEVRYCLAQLDLAQYESVIYGDEDSQALPVAVYHSLLELADLPVTWEFHGHNSYGLATANCLSAVRAGVRRIALSVASVGHTGHPAFEEVTAAAKYILKLGIDLPDRLQQCCGDLCACLGLEMPGNKAVIGADIFAHESGIHVDGVLKQPSLYEVFPPEAVGAARKLVIGKHSGSRSLTCLFDRQGITLTPQDAKRLLSRVRDSVAKTKQPVSDGQLYLWYREIMQERCLHTSRTGLLAGGWA